MWLVILALVLELVARATLTSPSRQVSDPELGYVNQPNSWLFQAGEGMEHIRLNALGLNDPDRAPIGHGQRVLLVGDSMLLAHQVPRPRNYASLVEQRTGIEMVNGGRDAMGPADWGAMMERLGPRLHPDYVALMMTRGDAYDLRDAHVRFVPDASAPLGERVERQRPDRDAVADKLAPVLQRSALLTFLMRRARLYLDGVQHGSGWTGFVLRGFHAAPPGRDETLDFPIEETTAHLAELMRLAQSGHRVMFISIPSFAYHSDGRIEFEPRSRVEQRVFPEAARRAGVPFVDLAPELMAIYRHDQRPFVGFDNSRIGTGHLNEYGHAVVAQLIECHIRALMRQADIAAARVKN